MENLSFYKFVNIENPKKMRVDILKKARELNIKGKILIAGEGINGYLSAEKEDMDKFRDYLKSLKEFKDLWFKENPTNRYNSKRMLVKIRKEIITFKKKIDMRNTGAYISPKELDELYEKGEDFLIVDTRNDYEYDVGHFKNAIKLETDKFTEFPREIEKIREISKGKKIITYCTGGVRCEKATAYMKEAGFENVMQLEGGIINYGIERGEGNWEGRCFVFDDRGAIKIDPKIQEKDSYSQCTVCYLPSEEVHKCPNCNKEFIICPKCHPLLEGSCSKFCRNQQRKKREILIEITA